MLAGPGTRGPSILHQSPSKSTSRALRDTPRRRITARVDLEGSRGLESLPGALFFSRYMSLFSETCHFLAEKNRRRQPREPQTRAGGRRQAGGGRRQAIQGPPPGRKRPPAGRKRPPPGRRRPGGRGAAGRPKSGKSQKCPKCLWGAPGASGGSPCALRCPPGTPWGPMGAHGAPWGPLGPHGPPLRCGTCAKRIVHLFLPFAINSWAWQLHLGPQVTAGRMPG